MIQLLSDTRYLMIRALRETARQPALEIGNVFIPFFFFETRRVTEMSTLKNIVFQA